MVPGGVLKCSECDEQSERSRKKRSNMLQRRKAELWNVSELPMNFPEASAQKEA